MATLAARVLADIQRHRLVPSGARAIVALSGGGDSVALLHARKRLVLAGAAHLNHQLRASEADDDEAFCRALTGRLGIPFVSDRVDVASLARAQRRSIEDAARAARYAFLDRARDHLGADVVATGHTRDDQAETFLLRIIRGAGTRGLGVIRRRAGRIVRPLLDCTREELRAYLLAKNEAFREDATNADVRVARNRVRHELIPLLRSRFSPGVVATLAREAALAEQDEDFLSRQAIDLAGRIVLSGNDTRVEIAAAGLASAHRALSSRVAQIALARFAGRRPIAFDHVDRLLGLAGSVSNGAVSLPGQTAIKVGDVISLRPDRRQAVELNSFAFPLSIPGEVHAGGWTVGAAELSPAPERLMTWAGRGSQVGVAAAAVALPLAVRSRRPGDRFRPLGAPGGRKLQDFLVDRKVPRADRESLPLVVDGRGRIVWVAGQAVAEPFRVHDPSQGVILLTLRRLSPVCE